VRRDGCCAREVDDVLPSAVLALEAIVVLLVVPAVAHDSDHVALQASLAAVLAVFLLLAAARGRHRLGRVVGSFLQLVLIGSGLIAWPMWILGTLFAGLWIAALKVDADVRDSAGG
jgi:hypothetical protein